MSGVSGEGATAAAVDSSPAGASTDTATQGHTFDRVGVGGQGGETAVDHLAQLGPDEPTAGRDLVFDPEGVGITEPLDPAQRAVFGAWADTLETGEVVARGPAKAYQETHTGDVEYEVSEGELAPREAWADGLNRDLGLAQDAKYVSPDSPTSFYVPSTMDPYMEIIANERNGAQIAKYGEVVDDPGNPLRGLEIITNNDDAAAYFRGLMEETGVPGVVRVRE